MLTFGLIYWWIDGGRPTLRAAGAVVRWDSQSFSPTDTMPLTHRVKLLFTLQSSISLVTTLVTVSRATDLIPGK